MDITEQPVVDATFDDTAAEVQYGNPYEDNLRDRPPGIDPPIDSANSSHVGVTEDGDDPLALLTNEPMLLQRAEEIYRDSTDYMNANITTAWETNLAHFHNEHAPGTPYRDKGWKRSRLFRPKTRAITKSQEATLAAAAFATQEYLNVEAEDPLNEAQKVSAEINKNILQYRLDRKMPWFLTVQGAFQDTKNYGICLSYQYWDYQQDTQVTPAFDSFGVQISDPDTGELLGHESTVVRADKLCVDNIAPENFRFDPMSDWRDPINSSPYLIYLVPMYAGDVLNRMRQVGPDGKPVWHKHNLSAVLAARREDFDRTRQAREGDSRIDPADEQHSNEYTTVWAHMNIIRVAGDDYVYWTLGSQLILTLPKLLTEAYPHLDIGERPFVMGTTTVETHRVYPSGDHQQSAGLQQELNANANQRMDNVKLVLNKRYYIKRGSQVDLDALMRNVSGGGVMMNDPEKDVKTIETRDVTASSYQEQNLLNVEIDELRGNFSQGENQAKRNPGNTATGITEISGSANAVQDYSIRIFMETWMEPVLRQCIKLIQYYETDSVVLAIAANQSAAWQRYGADEITDELLRQDLTVRVNLGIGNTDPVRRVERLVYAVERTGGLPGMAERMKPTEIGNEIFGALGYKNSSRFFMTDDEMQQKMSEQGEQGPPPEIAIKMQELQIRQQDNEQRHQREMIKLQIERETQFAAVASKEKITLQQLYANLGVEEMKDATARDTAALRERNKITEMNLKRATGSGI